MTTIKISSLILMFTFISNITLGQPIWQNINSNTSEHLNAIKHQNGVFIATGNNGLIIRSINGNDWTIINSNTVSDINSVDFKDNDTIFAGANAIGTSTTILRSSDGGYSWEDKSISPLQLNIYDLQFTNSNRGFFVGKGQGNCISLPCEMPVHRTINAGETLVWKGTYMPDSGGVITYGVDFLTNKIGYVVGDNARIIKTKNGGNSWTDISSKQVDTNNTTYYGIAFINQSTGFIVGSDESSSGGTSNKGYILKTIDSGNTWQVHTVSPKLYAINMLNDTVGYAVGAGRSIFKTKDMGETWILEYSSHSAGALKDIIIIDEENAYAVGENGSVLYYGETTLPLNANFEMSNDTQCISTPVTFTNFSTGADSYKWYVNGTLYSTSRDTSYQSEQAETVIVKLVVDSSGAKRDSMEMQLTTINEPIPLFVLDKDTAPINGPIVVLNQSQSYDSILWTLNSQQLFVTSNEAFSLDQVLDHEGTYTLEVIIKSKYCDGNYTYSKDFYIEDESINSFIFSTSEEHRNITISPNPNNGNFVLSSKHLPEEGSSLIRIYNASGLLIKELKDIEKADNYIQLDTPDGIYNIVVSSENRTYSNKFVKLTE